MRPLSLGEILDVAIKVTTRNARTFLLIVLVVVAPLEIVRVLITSSVAPELLALNTTETTVATDTFVAGLVAEGLVGVIVFLLSTAACTKAVADAYRGTSPDWRESLRFGVRRAPSSALLTLLLGFLLILAFVALIVPGIWLGIAWSLAIPVLLIEERRGSGALRRSFALVRGRWWQVAGALLVGLLLASVVGGIVSGVLTFAPALIFDDNIAVNAVATAAGTIVGSLITTPFQAALVTILYFDMRVRKEGLDLEHLAQRIGGGEEGDQPDAFGQPTPWARPGSPALLGRQYTEQERAQAPYWPPPAGWKPEPASSPEGGPEPPPGSPSPVAHPETPAGSPPPQADPETPPGRWLPPQSRPPTDDG